jgi:hypothetical protein
MSQRFIQLSHQLQLRIDYFKSEVEPFRVAIVQNELFFQNFQKVVAVIATYRHNCQVVAVGSWQNTGLVH